MGTSVSPTSVSTGRAWTCTSPTLAAVTMDTRAGTVTSVSRALLGEVSVVLSTCPTSASVSQLRRPPTARRTTAAATTTAPMAATACPGAAAASTATSCRTTPGRVNPKVSGRSTTVSDWTTVWDRHRTSQSAQSCLTRLLPGGTGVLVAGGGTNSRSVSQVPPPAVSC